MITLYIFEFILFSFVGWIIDSLYRSIINKRWINAGYFSGSICPIYGFGGVILVFILKTFSELNLIWLLVIASITMILVEYIGGIFSEKVLKVRLWDYSKTTFNIGGHIDALHSFYLVILVVVFYFFIYPLVSIGESLMALPESFDLPVLVAFMIIGIWMTAKRSPEQFVDIKGKLLNMSVSDYNQLFSNMKKLSKAKTKAAQDSLYKIINAQLKSAGATLKKLKMK